MKSSFSVNRESEEYLAKKHQCKLCDASFSRYNSLTRHFQDTHDVKNEPTKTKSADEGEICKICKKTFYSSMARHMLLKHGMKDDLPVKIRPIVMPAFNPASKSLTYRYDFIHDLEFSLELQF